MLTGRQTWPSGCEASVLVPFDHIYSTIRCRKIPKGVPKSMGFPQQRGKKKKKVLPKIEAEPSQTFDEIFSGGVLWNLKKLKRKKL